MGDGPTTDSQECSHTSQVSHTETAASAHARAPAVDSTQSDQDPVDPISGEPKPLFTAITEACGELNPQHLPGCCEKNCTTKEIDEMEREGEDEPDEPHYWTAQPRQPLRQVKLGRLLCSILRHRARQMGLPMTTEGFTPLEQLVRHPIMDLYGVDEVLELVKVDAKRRYKVVQDSGDQLHIRAQNGHSRSLDVDIKFRELKAHELPKHVTHVTMRHNISSILESGVSSGLRHYVHLLERIPPPGEVLPGERRENGALVIIDVGFAVKLGIAGVSPQLFGVL